MRVQFLPTCLVESLRPDVAEAALGALRAAGHEPRTVAGATCCGQPAYNAGFAAEARRVARRTLGALGDGEQPCVVASGSCATMISHLWPRLFEGTRHLEAARKAAGRTVELTAFLAPRSGGGPEPRAADAQAAGGDGKESDHDPQAVVVHDSCHALRELGTGDSVRLALADAGYAPVTAEGTELCCGFGGSFSVKLPEVSVAMADEKLDGIAAAGCEQVTGCDLSCLLHLDGRARRRGLPLRFDHVATLLDGGT